MYMKDNKIIIKTNIEVDKYSTTMYNFLPYMINYLYDFVKKYTLEKYNSIVVSRNCIMYDWYYDVIIENKNNVYEVSVSEYIDTNLKIKNLSTITYKLEITEQEILDLYVFNEITNDKYLENYVTFIQEKTNEN